MTWNDSLPWLVVGLVGQGAFFARFLVQWVVSERAGESFIPVSFWYLSVVGSIILLVYAIHRAEPVFLLGQLPNAFVYVRNLMLIKRSGTDRSASARRSRPLGRRVPPGADAPRALSSSPCSASSTSKTTRPPASTSRRDSRSRATR